MVNAELLKDLCCPETHQPLRAVPGELLQAINERIRSGGVRNRSGHRLAEPCEDGLLREDGTVFYPVRRGLPILLVAEAIAVA